MKSSMKMKLRYTGTACFVLACGLILTGCASVSKKSPFFTANIKNVKTIAVMPADIKVYQLTAGGVQELIDEWSESSKQMTQEALRQYLGERFGFTMKFIDEGWLKENHKDLWNANRALYEAVSYSALAHAYPGPDTFKDKVEMFDYTLGEEIQDLAKACEADALLFISGFDYEATAGRTALLFWNIMVGAVTGVTVIPKNPSLMTIGMVNAKTGSLDWFKISPADMEYSFRNKKHIEVLVEWLTRDFLKTK